MRTNEEIATEFLRETQADFSKHEADYLLLFLNEATESRDKEIKALKIEIGKLEPKLQWIKLGKVLEKS